MSDTSTMVSAEWMDRMRASRTSLTDLGYVTPDYFQTLRISQ
jgi:hypothetical protein